MSIHFDIILAVHFNISILSGYIAVSVAAMTLDVCMTYVHMYICTGVDYVPL